MKKKKRTVIRLVAVLLAVLMIVTSITMAMATDETKTESESKSEYSVETKYDSPDINELTGHGANPEEISVSAAATYAEKEWYEYVTYSDKAVASYRIDDDTRLLFYDPYTYTNAMVMDVQFDATTTEFDTMSSYSISHTTSKSISASNSSTYTSSTATQSSGRDETGSKVSNSGTTVTAYNHTTESKETGGDSTTWNYGSVVTKEHNESISTMLGAEVGVDNDICTALVRDEMTVDISDSYSESEDNTWSKTESDDTTINTTYSGEDTVTDNTTSETTGWTQLSDRITQTLGSSRSTSTSWSETESTTVSKTYAATHFASDGVTPLPWAIVHYTVQMPMKCSMQYKYEGEWITISTIYCMLTTVKGTCRAWMQNGQVYYEDWGNGEPVVATDFWSQFMTEEQLVSAYRNKLYPTGGVD